MKPIYLQFRRQPQDHFEYAISNVRVSSDAELAELSNWRTAVHKSETGHYHCGSFADIDQATPLYQGPGWIANDHRQVKCWLRRCEVLLRIENLGDFVLSEDSCTLLAPPWQTIEWQWLIEVMLGPGLILPLAYRNIFSLHASAVETDNGACAFIGESGQGKATLARSDRPDWRRISDDILPIALADSTAVLFPTLFKKSPAIHRPILSSVNVLGR